jgi:hypothetical protein
MSLHHTQRKKYQGLKEAGMTAEELKAEMLTNEISEADADQFIAEIYATAQDDAGNPAPEKEKATAPVAKAAEVAQPTAPQFNYKALEGKHYDEYQAYIASLPLFELRTFQCFKAEEVKKERFQGMPGSPWDVVGIRIVNDTPLHTSKINVKTANELNAQLPNSRRIYLLKQ